MSAGEPLQAEKIADEIPEDGKPVIPEIHDDDAWIAACRTGVTPEESDADSAEIGESASDKDAPETAHSGDDSRDNDDPATLGMAETGKIDSDEITADDAEPEVFGPAADKPTDALDAEIIDFADQSDSVEVDAEIPADLDDMVEETATESDAVESTDDAQSADETSDIRDENEATTLEASSLTSDAADSADEDVISLSGTIATTAAVAKTDVEEQSDDPQDDPVQVAAEAEETDDAMSEFGNAISALAADDSPLDDFDDAPGLYNQPEPKADDAVAPYIAQAERELEQSRARTSHDIFDRIAMAAESQFDNSRVAALAPVKELVDDRRVGTKRWTPSKTMKERMAKLEAARAAAESGETLESRKKRRQSQQAVAPKEVEETVTETAAVAEEAVTTAKPVAKPAPEAEPAEEVVAERALDENERVKISRRDRHAAAEQTEDAALDEDIADSEELDDEDVDGLRIVPGARGRRRDRARRSRLDEDFEKIFDEDEKPSIRGLRRKLRSGAAAMHGTAPSAEPAEDKAVKARKADDRRAVMQNLDSEDAAESKGLFARLFRKNADADKVQSGGFLAGLLSRSKTEDTEGDIAFETVADNAAPAALDDAVEDEVDYALETPRDEAPTGLFARFRRASKGKSTQVDVDEDELVAAFEADSAPLNNPLDIAREEEGADEAWEQTLDSSRDRSPLVSSIMGVGVIGILVGFGFFAYRFFNGL